MNKITSLLHNPNLLFISSYDIKYCQVKSVDTDETTELFYIC